MTSEQRQEDINKVIKNFAQIVKQREKRAIDRLKFVQKTFGKIARQIHEQRQKNSKLHPA